MQFPFQSNEHQTGQMPCRTSHEEVHYFLQRNRGMEKRYYYTGKHCECLPTLCHTQNAEKMTRKKPSASDHCFQLLLPHYLLMTCFLPDTGDTGVNRQAKVIDTYIPSSITYDLISRNRTITAPTWWDWFENEVNICSARKAMLVQTGTSHAKVCSIRQQGKTG